MSTRVVQRIVPREPIKANGTSKSASASLLATDEPDIIHESNSNSKSTHVHSTKTPSSSSNKLNTRSSHSKTEGSSQNSASDVDGTQLKVAPSFVYNPSPTDLDALPEFEDRLTLAEICRARDAGIVTHELLAICVQACGYADNCFLFIA